MRINSNGIFAVYKDILAEKHDIEERQPYFLNNHVVRRERTFQGKMRVLDGLSVYYAVASPAAMGYELIELEQRIVDLIVLDVLGTGNEGNFVKVND